METSISKSLQKMRRTTTVALTGNILSTVWKADRFVYQVGGEFKAHGSFDEVRQSVPEFDRQVELMGLEFIQRKDFWYSKSAWLERMNTPPTEQKPHYLEFPNLSTLYSFFYKILRLKAKVVYHCTISFGVIL